MASVLVSDVDGVLTDGRLFIEPNGERLKTFDVKDGRAIVDWTDAGNEFVIATGRSSPAVERRAKELGIERVHLDVSDKRSVVESVAADLDVPLSEVAYVGDDHSDVAAIEAVGFGAAPTDAADLTRRVADYVAAAAGGRGAIEEIVTSLLTDQWTAMAVIPARYGSTRFPGKPLADIAGKPMIQRVYERTVQATELDETVVATDDERIVEAVESIGGTAVMTSSDHESGTERVAAVADNFDHEVVVNVQGDEPLMEPDVIDDLVRALRDHPERVATPITPLSVDEEFTDEHIVKVVTDADDRAVYFSRAPIPSRGAPDEAFKHIGAYAFRQNTLQTYVELESELETAEDLEQLRLLENGYDIRTVTVAYDPVGVDVEEDLNTVEKIIRENDGI